MRQFILSLAVRGKLVPQFANERRASNFDAELPIDIKTSFEIPQNWRWSRLRKLENWLVAEHLQNCEMIFGMEISPGCRLRT